MKLSQMQLRKIITEELDNDEAHSLLYNVAFDAEIEQSLRQLCTVWAKKVQERLAEVEVGSRSIKPNAIVNMIRNGLLAEIRVQIVDACESVERKCGL